MISAKHYENLFKGRPAAILGGGPSLPDDLTHVPNDAILYSINHHALKIIDCQFLVYGDPLRKADQGLIEALDTFKGVRLSQYPEQSDINFDGVDYFDGGMSATFATWFALYTGAYPVILCGMDCFQGDRVYFHDGPVSEKAAMVANYPLENHLNAWQKIIRHVPRAHPIKAASGPLIRVFGRYVKPLYPKYDIARDIVEIEGVKYHGSLFRTLAFPDTNGVYSFSRDGDQVTITKRGGAELLAKVKDIAELMKRSDYRSEYINNDLKTGDGDNGRQENKKR